MAGKKEVSIANGLPSDVLTSNVNLKVTHEKKGTRQTGSFEEELKHKIVKIKLASLCAASTENGEQSSP